MSLTTVAPDEIRMIDVMRNSLYPGARPESVSMVLSYCRARGLDPLRKPVHIVPMWVKQAGSSNGAMQDVVMPGIALYRIEAARTGEYAGKTEPEFGPTVTGDFDGLHVSYPEWCRVTVQRIVGGSARAFTAKEYWLENYATMKKDSEQPNAMWRKRAFGQLAKCAEAQALRMAFPEATGGEATAEEMEGKTLGDSAREVPNRAAQPSAPAPAGSMREVAQDLVAAKLPSLPIITPTGDLITVNASRWVAAVGKALAKLDSEDALYVWRRDMGPHFTAVHEHDEAMLREATRLIGEREMEFLDAQHSAPAETVDP